MHWADWDSEKKNLEDFAKLNYWAKTKSPLEVFTNCPKWAKQKSCLIFLQVVPSEQNKRVPWYFSQIVPSEQKKFQLFYKLSKVTKPKFLDFFTHCQVSPVFWGGGRAASKWRSHFGALVWLCGVSEVNTAKATDVDNLIISLSSQREQNPFIILWL